MATTTPASASEEQLDKLYQRLEGMIKEPTYVEVSLATGEGNLISYSRTHPSLFWSVFFSVLTATMAGGATSFFFICFTTVCLKMVARRKWKKARKWMDERYGEIKEYQEKQERRKREGSSGQH